MTFLVKFLAAVIVISIFLAVWSIESKRRIILTPFMLLMYFELVRILPAFFLADNYGVSGDLVPLMIALLAFISLALGFVCVYFSRSTSPNRVLQLSQSREPIIRIKKKESLAVLILALLLIGLGLYFYQGLPVTVYSVYGVFTGDAADLARNVSGKRFELTKGAYFGEEYRGQGLIRTVQRIGWALICCYTLMIALQRKKIKSILIFISVLFLTWIFVAGPGERAPFLAVLIIVVAALSFRKALSFKFVFFAIFGIILLAIFLSVYSGKMYFLFAKENSLVSFMTKGISKISDRIFIANAMNDVRLIELVNSGEWNPEWGKYHIRDVITSLPGVQYGMPLSHKLHLYIKSGSGKSTFASGTYLSNVYADFSWYGVFPLFFLAGVFVGLIQFLIFNVKLTPWNISVAAVISYYSARVVSSGFNGVIASFVVIAVLSCIYFMLSILAKATQKKLEK